jgi:hypothetical protein
MNRGLRVLASISLVGLSGLPAMMPQVHAQTQTVIITYTRPPPNCNNTGTCIETGSGYSSGGNGGGGGGYIPENEASDTTVAAANGDVCKNRLASPTTRSTHSLSDQNTRYEAAMQLFNAIKLFQDLRAISQPYQFVENGVAMVVSGFAITYSDGAKEAWVVKSDYRTSSVSLLDLPLPNMTPPTKPAGSSCQAG